MFDTIDDESFRSIVDLIEDAIIPDSQAVASTLPPPSDGRASLFCGPLSIVSATMHQDIREMR